ncbi:MAG: NAD(P)H-dependent oxidoreductase [Parachlamydiaceae bacterium]
MKKPKILAFAGSTRTDSFNKKLIQIAINGAKKAGAEVTYIDLRDFPLPLYDGDLEAAEGLPENAKKLKRLFIEHQGLLIASPEYNSSISGVLKNTLDWVSRPAPGEGFLACFNNKVAGIMSASLGELGGLRGLVTLRSILGNINVLVVPQQVSISNAGSAFENNTTLKDAKRQASVESIGEEVTKLLLRNLN